MTDITNKVFRVNLTNGVWEVAVNDQVVFTVDVSVPGAVGNGVPAGGTDGQVLTKTSGVDFQMAWEDPVVGSVFGRTGAVVAADGDYTSDQVTEGTSNLYNRVPDGGSTGQVLAKVDGTDLNVHWVDPPASGVSSVFGRTGVVTAQSGDYTASQVGLGSVTNNAQLTRGAADWAGFTGVTPAAGDMLLIEDASDSYAKKTVLISELPVGSHGHVAADITDWAGTDLSVKSLTTSDNMLVGTGGDTDDWPKLCFYDSSIWIGYDIEGGNFLQYNKSLYVNGEVWADTNMRLGVNMAPTDPALEYIDNAHYLKWDVSDGVFRLSHGLDINGPLTFVGPLEEFTVRNEPSGFENSTDSVLTFTEGTRKLSIAPAVTSYDVWVAGVKYVKTVAEEVTLADTDTLFYIYFDKTTHLLTYSADFSEALISQHTLVAAVYWDAVNNKAVLVADLRHQTVMDNATHLFLNYTIGAQVKEGLAPNALTVDGDGSSNSHATLGVNTGSFLNMDLSHQLTAATSPAQIPVLYQSGSAWRRDTARDYPVKQGTGLLAYNLYTGGAWTQATCTSGYHVLAHIFATSDATYRFVAVQGRAQYSTAALAAGGCKSELTALYNQFPMLRHFAPVCSLIFQTATGYTNTPKARIVSAGGLSYIDNSTAEVSVTKSVAPSHLLLANTHDVPDAHGVDNIGDSAYSSWEIINPSEAGLLSILKSVDDSLVTFNSHAVSTSNPHSVTASQVGLGSVTNDAQLKRSAGDWTGFTELTTLATDDLLLVEDTSDSGAKKKVQVVNLAKGQAEAIEVCFDGGGAELTDNKIVDVVAKCAMTITGWTLLADQSGSVEIGVWKDTYANFPPTVADVLVSPSITTATKAQASSLSLAVAAGDVLRFNVNSCTTIQRITLALTGVRA